MSIKFVFLFVLAFVAVQQASARTPGLLNAFAPGLSIDDTGITDVDAPLKVQDSILDLSPTSIVRRLVYFPLRLAVHVLRVLLFPVRLAIRLITYPFRRIYYLIRVLTYPITRVVRLFMYAIWRLLSVIPVIRIPALASYYLYRMIAVPFRIIRRVFGRILF